MKIIPIIVTIILVSITAGCNDDHVHTYTKPHVIHETVHVHEAHPTKIIVHKTEPIRKVVVVKKINYISTKPSSPKALSFSGTKPRMGTLSKPSSPRAVSFSKSHSKH